MVSSTFVSSELVSTSWFNPSWPWCKNQFGFDGHHICMTPSLAPLHGVSQPQLCRHSPVLHGQCFHYIILLLSSQGIGSRPRHVAMQAYLQLHEDKYTRIVRSHQAHAYLHVTSWTGAKVASSAQICLVFYVFCSLICFMPLKNHQVWVGEIIPTLRATRLMNCFWLPLAKREGMTQTLSKNNDV